MITGSVTASGEARIALDLLDAAGHRQTVMVDVDAGFTGMLVLPADVLQKLGTGQSGQVLLELADDQAHTVESYYVNVEWHGSIIEAPAYSLGSSALAGMSMLHGSTLYIDVTEGGRVEIPRPAHINL